MNRIWFALIFLMLSGVMCAGEQTFINSFYSEINENISVAEAALDNNDIKKYNDSTREIAKLWSEKNDVLYAVGEHAQLDTIAVSIRSMPYNKDDEKKELRSLRAMLKAYYENERVSLSNIF